MAWSVAFLCLCVCAVAHGSAISASVQNSISPNGDQRRTPAVDALISRLEGERWSPDGEDCLQATLEMLRGVKNNTLWAVWTWESMQPPMGSMYGAEAYLGNYDQCMKSPWTETHPGLRNQYCLLQVHSTAEDQVKDLSPFDDAEDYYKTPTKDGRRFNRHYFGVCLPSICSAPSVSKVAQHMLDITHLPGTVSLDSRDCQKAGVEAETPSKYYVFWYMLALLIAIAAYSTYGNEIDENTFLGKITHSFCMKRNYNNLFTVSRDEVKVLHGMRFITAAIIVAIHEYFYLVLSPVLNALDVNKRLNSTFGLSVAHLDVLVDTFFAMSGMLIVRGLLMGKQSNLLFTLVKRHLRLVGPYALCIAYIVSSAMYMNDGPFWNIINRDEVEVCTKYWWKSLLMINTDIHSLCHVVTWYISNDYQLAVLATFLFFIFRKSKKLAVALFVIIAVVSTGHLSYNVYSRRLDILPFTYKAISLRRNFTDLHYIYTKSHVRVGAYLVGMVMGYLITVYKPSEHRNSVGKGQSIIIGTVSLLTMYAILAVALLFEGRPYDALEAAVVVATNRIVWAVAICCLIGVSEYGNFPLVTDLLGWHRFVPLSKLSYCLYLVHPIVIQLYKFNARGPAPYHVYSIFVYSCGALLVSLVLSLVLHLMTEAPLINLSNELFKEGRKKKLLEQNGTKEDLNQNEVPKVSPTEKKII